METLPQGHILLVAGSKESVDALLNGEVGRSMQKNGGVPIIIYDGDILADLKEPSSHTPEVTLPQEVVVETVIFG